ncbi:MAG TPA: PA14 domain-containing protein [Gemmataceae bacterium]|nr:PA14 domain-containing protein [Gemmataceae bacterium]
MTWPLSQDYNEAIQDPSSCFSDPELRGGEPAVNALGLPAPCAGNFADVYQLRCGGRCYAVKCFTREIPGLSERYAQIAAYLQKVSLPFMVGFQFLEKGIRVHGQWYPVLKMDWVEGQTLNALVESCLDKRPVLETLAQIWLKLAQRLREANLAHCDLQHGNVLLVPGSKASALAVKLVDYDGMCVPALTLLKSVEVGHPAYQHPQRARDGTYGLEIDRFSHLVIYTALRALILKGRPLWERCDNGDNLLFRPQDFLAPDESELFAELLQEDDREVRRLTEELKKAAKGPIDQVPLLTDLVGNRPVTAAASERKQTAAPAVEKAERAEDVFAQAVTADKPVKARRPTAAMPFSNWAAVGGGVAVMVVLIGLITAGILLTRRNGTNPDPSNHDNPPAVVIPATDQKPAPKETARTAALDLGSHGLRAEYFEGTNLERKLRDRIETQLDWIWENGSPEQGIPADLFSARWTGWLKAPRPGTYRLVVAADDGVRLWLDDRLLVDRWLVQTVRCEVEVELTDRPHALRIEYFEQYGLAGISLGWAPKEGSAEQVEVIPPECLFHDQAAAEREAVALPERGAEVRSFAGHSEIVQCVAVSPDGRQALSGGGGFIRNNQWAPGADNAIRLWHVGTGQELRRLEGHTAGVCSVAFSPRDGRYALSAGRDKTIRLWNVASGKEIRSFTGHTDVVSSVVFLPDGRSALSASHDGTIRLWDTNTGQEQHCFREHQRPVRCVAVSPNGHHFVSGGEEGTIILWDLEGKKEVSRFARAGTALASLAFSPDGKQVVSGSANGAVQLWDVASGQEVKRFTGHTGWVWSVTFSPDGRRVLSGGQDRTLRLWDLASGREMRCFRGHGGWVHSVAFLPDGSYALSGGADQTVRLWNLSRLPANAPPAWPPAPPIAPSRPLTVVVNTPAEQVTQELRRFAVEPNRGQVSSVSFSPDGRHALAVQGAQAYLWNLEDGTISRTLALPPPATIREAIFLPDGRRAVSLNSDQTLSLWNLDSGQVLHRFEGHKARINCMALSADGRFLLSGGGDMRRENGQLVKGNNNQPVWEDCTVRVWDVETGKELGRFEGHDQPVQSVAISPDGTRAVSASVFQQHLWEVPTGKPLRLLARFPLPRLAYCPDGRRVIMATPDRSIKMWDLEANREVFRIEGVPLAFQRSNNLAISPDGRHFAASVFTYTIEDNRMVPKEAYLGLWETVTGKEVRRFPAPPGRPFIGIAFSPDGSRLLTGGDGMRLWDSGLGATAAVKSPAPTSRVPMPDETALAAAEKQIRERFKNEINSARSRSERLALTNKLLREARGSKDDAERFILFREAGLFALLAGDLNSAMKAADEAATRYDIPALRLKIQLVQLLEQAARFTGGPETNRVLVEAALRVVDELIQADDFDAIKGLLILAMTAAGRSSDGQLVGSVKACSARVETLRKEYEERVKPAQETLAKDFQNTEANLAVGRYLCLFKGQWDQGLAHLVRGGAGKLPEAAHKDRRAVAAAIPLMVEAGDAWWELAQTEPGGVPKAELQRRAHHWYQKALSGLSGDERTRIEQRIKVIQASHPDLRPPDPVGPIRRFASQGSIIAVGFAAEGRRAVSVGNTGEVCLWDVESDKPLQRFMAATGQVFSAACSADGKYVALATDGGIHVWSVEQPKKAVRQLALPGARAVAFARDGRWLAAAGSANNTQNLAILELASGRANVASSKGPPVQHLAIFPDGRHILLAAGDRMLHLWTVSPLREKQSWSAHDLPVGTVAISPNGQQVASTSSDMTVKIWDLTAAPPRMLHTFGSRTGPIRAMVYSPDGRRLLSVGLDAALRLWDTASGALVQELAPPGNDIRSVAFSPDGRRALTGSADGSVRLWGLPKP